MEDKQLHTERFNYEPIKQHFCLCYLRTPLTLSNQLIFVNRQINFLQMPFDSCLRFSLVASLCTMALCPLVRILWKVCCSWLLLTNTFRINLNSFLKSASLCLILIRKYYPPQEHKILKSYILLLHWI